MPLTRRNTISTPVVVHGNATTMHHHRSASFSTAAATFSANSSSPEGDTVPPKPTLSYASLKDLVSAPGSPVNSPTAMSLDSISIRSHLVKQAAWAYLQPVSTSPTSSAEHFFRRLLRNPFFSLIHATARAVVDVLCSCFMD